MPPITRPGLSPSPQITGNQSGGVVKGSVQPGQTVEVRNLSAPETTTPEAGVWDKVSGFFTGKKPSDAFVLGKADGSGQFTGKLGGLVQGDVLQVRTRDSDGKVSNWLTVRADGLGADTRNARLDAKNISLKDQGNGKVSISQPDAGKPVSEPDAYVEIRNTRSGETALIQCDASGNIPAGQTVDGKPGDTFTFHVSDGTNNDKFTEEAGRVTLPGKPQQVDLPDPKIHSKYNNSGGVAATKVRFSGPLFVDGASVNDVKQGYLGDCYLCSAAAALAQRAPEALQKAMKDNGDGTYTVTFQKYDFRTRGFRPEKVTVDGDLYAGSSGTPLYGKSTGTNAKDKMEMWFPILEKAWAQFKGSYDAMGSGGQAHEVMSAILGKEGSNTSIKGREEATWKALKDATDKKMPAAAGTFPESQAQLYLNTGVHADHAYTVMGVEQDAAGKRFVELRNPWAHDEPSGDGKDDGIFKMKWEDFTKLYSNVHVLR